MGGCYVDYASSARGASSGCSRDSRPSWQTELRRFSKTGELSDLLKAGKSFFGVEEKGFFAEVAKVRGIKNVDDIPKEFPTIEYEVKFDVQPSGEGTEPTVVDYLNAFDFPIGGNTRFIKDPVNNFAVGINHFIGDGSDERLVIIEKAGKLFLKKKGLVVPIKCRVPYENIVIKRTEDRFESSIDNVLAEVKGVTSEEGVKYRGKIRKEKGDVFVLDTNDGRLYSFTITIAHLTKDGEKKESGVQRQLEIEYAGYIPQFKGFEKDSETQIVRGMVDMAKYTFAMYNGAPIKNGWRMNLALTSERKYDFVLGESRKQALPLTRRLLEPVFA